MNEHKIDESTGARNLDLETLHNVKKTKSLYVILYCVCIGHLNDNM